MKANFTKASLIVAETRLVAGLLLGDASPDSWKQAIEIDNVLQKKTRNTALTYANLARTRLQTMGPALWQIIHQGSLAEARDGALAATVKFSPLFGDFLRDVLRDQFRRFATKIGASLWDDYIDHQLRAHPDVPSFNDSTRTKLRQNAMRILVEAGFVTDTQSLTLRPHRIEPSVRHCLEAHQERYTLECLQICP